MSWYVSKTRPQTHQLLDLDIVRLALLRSFPDSKVHGANMGPIWGRQNPGEHHVGPMNFAIRVCMAASCSYLFKWYFPYRPCYYGIYSVALWVISVFLSQIYLNFRTLDMICTWCPDFTGGGFIVQTIFWTCTFPCSSAPHVFLLYVNTSPFYYMY